MGEEGNSRLPGSLSKDASTAVAGPVLSLTRLRGRLREECGDLAIHLGGVDRHDALKAVIDRSRQVVDLVDLDFEGLRRVREGRGG